MKTEVTNEINKSSPLKIFPESFIIWRVWWQNKYTKEFHFFDLYEEREAYKLMSCFLRSRRCSWVKPYSKILLISYNHPMWYPNENIHNS